MPRPSRIEALVTGAMLLAGVAACDARLRQRASRQRVATTAGVPTVTVIQPVRGNAEEDLRLPGTLIPFERARLFAKVTGYLEAISVDIGAVVKRGDVLARLSVPEQRLAYQRAAADVPAARAKLKKSQADARLAELTYERMAGLHKREPRAITKQEVDVAAAKREVARALISIARANVRVALVRRGQTRTMVGYGRLRAPFAGVVTRRYADIGALITKGSKRPVVELSRVDKLRLVIDIPGPVVPYIKTGQGVSLGFAALGGATTRARIARLAGALKTSSRSMRAEIDLDNRDGKLHPGMVATVRLGVHEIPGALTIPSATLRSEGGQSYVLTATASGVVRRISVTVILDDGVHAVIAGALRIDSSVIKAGPPTLAAGQRIVVRVAGVSR